LGTHIYQKYPPNSNFGGKRVLNVGCGYGQFRAKNVTNLDAYSVCNPNVVWDLSKTPLPFEDETFDLILANHVMEHVPNWWDCFQDFSRILKVGGRLDVFVPGGGSDSILGYRDHINTINSCSFAGTMGTYRNGSNAWAEENRRGAANRLKMMEKQTRTINKWWIEKAPTAVRKWMCEHLRNVVVEDGYIFKKITEAEFREEELYANIGANGRGALQVLPVR